MKGKLRPVVRVALWLALTAALSFGQSNGRIEGTVSMSETGGALHDAAVLIVELGRSTLSGDDGSYSFDRVPPGNYHVVAHLDSLFTEAARVVEVQAGETASADFLLALTTQKYEIT